MPSARNPVLEQHGGRHGNGHDNAHDGLASKEARRQAVGGVLRFDEPVDDELDDQPSKHGEAVEEGKVDAQAHGDHRHARQRL